MKPQGRTSLAFVAAVSLAALAPAGAQTWPDKPIRFVIPSTPGGPADVLARAMTGELTRSLGQPFVIENRTGANFIIGSEVVAKAPADGYTILLTASPHTINPSLYPKLPFDPIKDFAPITIVATTPFVLVANPAVPAKNLLELIALAKARPGKLNYASAGSGSGLHLATELFKVQAGIDVVHVPYKGVSPAVVDVIAGQITFMMAGGPIALPQVQAGKLRAIATTGSKRTAAAPDLPTMAESGLPKYEFTAWYGLMAPAGTPAAIVARLHAETVKVLQLPEFKDRWTKIGADVAYSDSPAQFGTFLREDLARWGKFIKENGIKAE